MNRQPYYDLSKEAYTHLGTALTVLTNSSVRPELIELAFLRTSQINGCAYCLAMHTKSLRANNYPQNKLDVLSAWRFSTLFTAEEQLVLAWTENVTQLDPSLLTDTVYAQLETTFSPKQISDLTMAISLMNCFNRIAISMKQ